MQNRKSHHNKTQVNTKSHISHTNKNRSIIGVTWFLLSLAIGVMNDVLSKQLGQNLHPIEITFFRFLFSTLSLLPFMFYNGVGSFYTGRVGLHICRGALLFIGIAIFCYGLTIAPISVATVINFTIPLFTLILAAIFLKERVKAARWMATLIGFLGVMVVFHPKQVGFDFTMFLLLLSALLFAGLDVLNKRFVVQEGMLVMLFYTGLFTMLLGIVPTYFVWQVPSMHQLGLFFILGCGANLLLYCLLKGFENADASALAPFRYTELLISAAMGYLFFAEIPSKYTWLGAAIIVPSSFIVVYSEMRKSRR
jgi:S-adenosylmethionine uptake transporter